MKRRIFALLAALCLLAGCAGKTEPVSKKREHERGYDQAYLLA